MRQQPGLRYKRTIITHRSCTSSDNAYEITHLKIWPLCEETIGILTSCVFLISQCRQNWPNLWGVRRDGAGNEAVNLGRLADGRHEKRKPLTLLRWRPASPPFTHPTPHQALSGESERWFNFHTGSPHALGARCDKSHVWALWCEVLSTGSGLTVAAHLTCLRRTWNQGQKAWIFAT